jgi:hypothetical protein
VNILGEGDYRFTLRVTAANANAEEWMVHMSHRETIRPSDGAHGHDVSVTDGPRRIAMSSP